MLRLVTSALLVTLTSASFCGDSAIPFSLEILPDGQPVLGCARPTCFGWAPNGYPASNTAAFYRIHDHADGFIRTGRDSIPAYDGSYNRPQTAACETSFSSSNCAGLNQWVGGIAPLVNLSSYPTTLQCCTFDALSQSEDRGIASLSGGQKVVGGEALSGGVQYGFDYISDVAKVVRTDGSLQYDVSIRRMACTDLTDSAGSSSLNKPAAQAFQAPNFPVNQPLPLPPASQNGVLEELVQEQAVQLRPGTQFQPQPQFQQFQPQPQLFQPQPQFQQFQPPPFQQFQAPQYVPQAPVYNSPPVAFNGLGGGGGGGSYSQFCFTDDMTVHLIDGSTKRMDELTKKDWVLSVNKEKIEYVPVDFWLHRVPSQEAEFNEFETENGNTIKLTDKHYIFKGDCSRVGAGPVPIKELSQTAITADQVHAGDCLYTLAGRTEMHEVRVVRTTKVTQKGIYAPMTSTGRIIVNGVHASCHNIMQAHSMGNSVFEYVDFFNNIYDSIFGVDPNEIVETPVGLTTILAISELVMPKNLVTL